MNMRMCLNWKVLGGLAAVGAGIVIFAPNLVSSALPLLLLAACPLSMLVMAFGMKSMAGTSRAGAGATGQYTCPMHPQVPSETAGRCPTCGMALVPGSVAEREQDAPPERLPELKAKFVALRADEEALSREIAALERERVAQVRAGGVLSETKE